MEALWFLAGAAIVILLGIVVVAVKNRQPRGHDIGIRAHRREMQALSVEARAKVVERSGLQPPRGPGE